MKEIICYSPKHGNQISLVDDIDFDKVIQYRWGVECVKLKNGTNKFYAICSKLKIRMHQFILRKASEGCVIDHINGNSLDNTRENLREANFAQQGQNKPPKNKYKGISWDKNNKKYKCQALGEFIGLFDHEKSAAIEYDKYIIRKLGKLGSRLNFNYNPEQVESIKKEKCPVETRKQEKENRELPSNIRLIKNNSYQVRFQTNNLTKNKCFKNLQDAIQFREECLKEIENIEDEQKQEHYSKPINRNKDDIAFFLIQHEDKKYECLVDDDKWHDLTYNMSWHYSNGYAQTHFKKETKLLQRYLYEQYIPEKDISNSKIDHINRNPLDNRMSNLEPVSDGVNRYNIGETKNKWGYRGVKKSRNKFCAKLKYKGHIYYTSVFDTVEEAALAYNELAKEHYKHRAHENIIKDNIVFED